MSFSQKIFVLAFVLIIISVNIIGIRTINYNHENNIKKEVEKIILENNTIATSILKNKAVNSFEQEKDELVKKLDILSINMNNLNIEIYQDGNIIYSNDIKEVEKVELEEQKIKIKILPKENKTYIYAFLKIQKQNQIYEIYTNRDITNIFEDRIIEMQNFLKDSIIVTLISTTILAIAIYFMTRRIKYLKNNCSKLAQKDYQNIKKIRGHDEIAILGEHFDNMAKTIKNNLETIQKVADQRDLFIRDITHEIRSPLTVILGYSELLENVEIKEKEKIQKYASKIYEEGKYLEKLTQSLINILLLENKKMELKEENVSLIIEDAVKMVKEELNEKNIEIITNIDRNILKKVDESLIKSLIINLIKNSYNACKSKVGKIQINLDTNKIEVIDNGKGMTKEQIQKIKEPFYTQNMKRKEKFNGLGLGIPFCIKIAQIHKAKLEIESDKDKGTRVSFIFEKGENI